MYKSLTLQLPLRCPLKGISAHTEVVQMVSSVLFEELYWSAVSFSSTVRPELIPEDEVNCPCMIPMAPASFVEKGSSPCISVLTVLLESSAPATSDPPGSSARVLRSASLSCLVPPSQSHSHDFPSGNGFFQLLLLLQDVFPL